MINQLKFKPETFERIVEEAEKRGEDLGLTTPELEPGLEFFYNAFLALSSCRQIGFSEGPIPITAILEYSRHYQLDDGLETDLIFLVQHLDNVYLKFRSQQAKAKKRANSK